MANTVIEYKSKGRGNGLYDSHTLCLTQFNI